jgi:hypothetical protein
MDENFHPSTLSEILDRTAQIYRSRFLIFLGIAILPSAALMLPAGVGFLLSLWSGFHRADMTSGVVAGLTIGALGLISMPIFLATTSLSTAGMSHAASRAIFNQPITIRDAYKSAWRRGWRYIGLYLMEGVAVWVLPMSAWTLLVLISAGLAAIAQTAGLGGGGFFLFLGVLVFAGLFSYGLWMAIRLSLAFPATVVEQTGAWAALKRSFVLTKGTSRRIFVLYLLGLALFWILYLAVVVPVATVMSFLPATSSPQHAQSATTVAVFLVYGTMFAIQALTRPFYGIALMLFYYDQRVRQEAFDIEWMMLQAGLVVPPPVPSPPPAPPPVPLMEPQAPLLEPQFQPAAVIADVETSPTEEASQPDAAAQPATEAGTDAGTIPATVPATEPAAEATVASEPPIHQASAE